MQSKGLKLALATIVIALTFIISTNAFLVGNVVISNVGTIGYIITADSGLAADIQKAVTTLYSAGGGTVVIPAGNWTWNGETVTIPAGVNVIGTGLAGCQGHDSNWANYTAQTILHNNFPQGSMPVMFQVNIFNPAPSPTVHRATRISGIQFEATPPANPAAEASQGAPAIGIHQIYGFRVDHCTFIDFAGTSVSADANSGNNASQCSYGVVDHCFFSLPYKTINPGAGNAWCWGYGVIVVGAGGYILPTDPGWTYPVTSFFGQFGAVPGYTICYIEDCHFRYQRHMTASTEAGYYCSRFNLEEYPACGHWIAMSDVHGNQADGWLDGGRGSEVYNCTFIADTAAQLSAYPWWAGLNTAIYPRGGASLFYNNSYTGNGVGEGTSNSAFVTIGMGDDPDGAYWDNGMDVNQTYFWDNTYTNTSFVVVDWRNESYVPTLNVNYFERAPNQAQDGFTYTPYVYPNPLTLGG